MTTQRTPTSTTNSTNSTTVTDVKIMANKPEITLSMRDPELSSIMTQVVTELRRMNTYQEEIVSVLGVLAEQGSVNKSTACTTNRVAGGFSRLLMPNGQEEQTNEKSVSDIPDLKTLAYESRRTYEHKRVQHLSDLK